VHVTVTLAYVFTPEGDAALAAALEEAQRRSSDIVVVNVTRPPTGEASPYSEEQELDALQAKLAAAGVASEVRELPAGTDPVEAIIEAARDTGSELVVIGLRRRTALGKLVLGSTAQRLLLGLDCPVLAVKAPR
jgi:nucleotide-binding universal stress UspA family protein